MAAAATTPAPAVDTRTCDTMDKRTVHDALEAFETKFHAPVWDWMVHKFQHRDDLGKPIEPKKKTWGRFQNNELDKVKPMTGDLNVEILDISEDAAVFSTLLAEKCGAKRIVSLIRPELRDHVLERPDMDLIELDIADTGCYERMRELGKFDIIVLKECLHLVAECLHDFFTTLRSMLKPSGLIYLVWRPKNPPLPLPEPAMEIWRNLSPGRDEMLQALMQVGFKLDGFSASCPITIDKADWAAILKTGCLPAVKNAGAKCNFGVINEYVFGKPAAQLKFEEKLLMFVAWTE